MNEQTPPLATRGTAEAAQPVRRATLIKRTGIALAGVIGGGGAAATLANASKSAGHASKSSGLTQRDREILAFALRLEHLQVAFYTEAIQKNKLTGEVKQFAHVVGGEEHEHLVYLQHELGGSSAVGKYSFGNATASDKAFVKAAATIEDTGLAAYNGQAGNLSKAALTNVARVISVEARHAAWARSLAGELPAPVPADEPISAAQALKAIKPYLA